MAALATHRTVTLREGTATPVAVTVRELTVAEIRKWLADAKEASPDLVDNLILREVSLQDLTHLSSLTPEQMDELTPSELQRVLEEAKELNSHFFELLAGVQTLAKQMRSAASSEPSPA